MRKWRLIWRTRVIAGDGRDTEGGDFKLPRSELIEGLLCCLLLGGDREAGKIADRMLCEKETKKNGMIQMVFKLLFCAVHVCR